ncbi:hypothetical protein FISHEDRAFT_55113 [Fistulina hepatica ATCC 64428]|uniref:Uncharacterized protein n=1 Tax=Fistulina hepatica ATCC 64428 TaxID=1128425 RepID=A0A0D7ARN3_9AGAR|nr:hypothetical protein FISHEDRAFT_55113 [Fistulina hepatica ATCC 64428]
MNGIWSPLPSFLQVRSSHYMTLLLQTHPTKAVLGSLHIYTTYLQIKSTSLSTPTRYTLRPLKAIVFLPLKALLTMSHPPSHLVPYDIHVHYRKPAGLHLHNMCEWDLGLVARCYVCQVDIAQDWGLSVGQVADNNPLTHLDGLSGAIIDEDVVTSPNTMYIPVPPFGHREPWTEDSEWSITWMHPQDVGLELVQTLRKDLFIVKSKNVHLFNDLVRKVQGALKALICAASEAETSLPASAQGYEAMIAHMLARLQNIGFEWTTIMLLICETQRVLLESDAFVHYWSIHVPQFASVWPSEGRPELVNQKLMGAFTYAPDVALKFTCARIPVWLIRDVKEVPLLTTRIVRWDMPQPPSVTLNLVDSVPRFRNVWEGTAGHRGKYINMHRYTIMHLVFRYPWGENLEVYSDPEFEPILHASPTMGIVVRPTTSSMVMFSKQSSGPTPNASISPSAIQYASTSHTAALPDTITLLSVASTRKRPAPSSSVPPGPKKKKSKDMRPCSFKLPPDPDGLSAPRSTWRKAFEDVSVDLDLPTQTSAELRQFFFPPISMFSNSMRADKHTLNWIYLCAAWTGRFMSTFQPCGLTAPEWQEVLGINTHTPQGTSHSATRRQQGKELLRKLFKCGDLNEMGGTINFHYMNISTSSPVQLLVCTMVAWEANKSNTWVDMAHFLAHGTSIDNFLAHPELIAHIFDCGKRAWQVIWMPCILDFDWKVMGLCSSDYAQRKVAVVGMIHGSILVPMDLVAIIDCEFNAALESIQSEEELDRLEDAIALHYCTCFYNAFAHPPTPPHIFCPPDESHLSNHLSIPSGTSPANFVRNAMVQLPCGWAHSPFWDIPYPGTEATWKSEDPTADWQKFQVKWVKAALEKSLTLEHRHPAIRKLKAEWVSKLQEEFNKTSVTKSQAGKALDNAIKDACKTLQAKVGEASSVDVNKLQSDDPMKYKNAGGATHTVLSQLWNELTDAERAEYDKEAKEKADVDSNIAQFSTEMQIALKLYTKSLIMGPGGGEVMLFYGFRNSKNKLKAGVILSHCPSNFDHPLEIDTTANAMESLGVMDMTISDKVLFDQFQTCWEEMIDMVILMRDLNEYIDVDMEVIHGLPLFVYDANDDELTDEVAVPWDELSKRSADFYNAKKVNWINTKYVRDPMRLPEGINIWDVAKHFVQLSASSTSTSTPTDSPDSPLLEKRGPSAVLPESPTQMSPTSPSDPSPSIAGTAPFRSPDTSLPLPSGSQCAATSTHATDGTSTVQLSMAPPIPSSDKPVLRQQGAPGPETPQQPSAPLPTGPALLPDSSATADAPPQLLACDLPQTDTPNENVIQPSADTDESIASKVSTPTVALMDEQLTKARAMADVQAQELRDAAAASLTRGNNEAGNLEKPNLPVRAKAKRGRPRKQVPQAQAAPVPKAKRGHPRKQVPQAQAAPVPSPSVCVTRASKHAREVEEVGPQSKKAKRD